jgi:hypothetical protein
VVSHHAQIEVSVHGAATHENNATMSLYGYCLAYYVVEATLADHPVERVEWTLYGCAWLGMSG